jgi:hypothetical protein
MKAENVPLFEQEQWKNREEEWKSFCKHQELTRVNFKRYVDAIPSGRQKGSVDRSLALILHFFILLTVNM